MNKVKSAGKIAVEALKKLINYIKELIRKLLTKIKQSTSNSTDTPSNLLVTHLNRSLILIEKQLNITDRYISSKGNSEQPSDRLTDVEDSIDKVKSLLDDGNSYISYKDLKDLSTRFGELLYQVEKSLILVEQVEYKASSDPERYMYDCALIYPKIANRIYDIGHLIERLPVR